MSKLRTMRVAEVPGERFRYWVESASEPGMAHTVDLAQQGGLGSCTCRHYEFRVWSVQRSGEYCEWRPGRSGCSECRHIWGARRHFILHHLMPLMSSWENGEPRDLSGELRKFLAWEEEKANASDSAP